VTLAPDLCNDRYSQHQDSKSVIVRPQMALTFPDVLITAKELANRLKGHESTADDLLSKQQSVCNDVEAQKEYEERISHLNSLASERPRFAIVAGIQQENKHITNLQLENRELRIALEEQQNAIDLIMTKYRQQVMKLTDNKRLDEKLLKSIDTNTQVLRDNADEINEMRLIMRTAIDVDEAAIRREEEVMAALWKENRGLREMLQIAGTYGSYNTKIFGAVTEDKAVQTEEQDLTSNFSPESECLKDKGVSDSPPPEPPSSS